jgi:ferredoxin
MLNRSQVDPNLKSEIRNYGDFDVKGCYECGSCLVKCPLSGDSSSFPRKSIGYAQVGLKNLLVGNLEPWLCYYCGDCSTTCPQQTEPGEAMMTLRRYLTSRYDWTGLSAKFYRSKFWEFGSLILVGAFVLFLALMLHGPVVTDRVELNTFAPVELVHTFDMILLGVLSFFLLSNVFRMWWFTVFRSGLKISPLLYVTELKTLIWHAATQIQFSKCANKIRWIKHWLLAAAYVVMFTLIIGFLWWFQTDNLYPLYHPQRWLGYLAAGALIYLSAEILVGRRNKREQIHKFSHSTDWLFPILLFLTAVTGIGVHIFRYVGWPLATYATYVIHLVICVPMLVIEVPFGKWSHLAYRPLAVYFQAVKNKALEQQRTRDAGMELAQTAP